MIFRKYLVALTKALKLYSLIIKERNDNISGINVAAEYLGGNYTD